MIALITCFVAAALTAPMDSSRSRDELFRRDSIKLVDELGAMLKSDQQFRKGGRRNYAKNKEAANAIDSQHVERFAEIIQMYGFPSIRRFRNGQPGLMPYIVLLHTPYSMADRMKVLLAEELKAGRICENEYAHVMWHLNRRVDAPVFVEATKVDNRGRVRSAVFSPCPQR